MIEDSRLLASTEVEPPAGLPPHALFAWRAAVDSIGFRTLTPSDLMTLEAGCRAWARWRAIEEKIAQLSNGNVLAAELRKSASGALQTSALRTAANAALAEWKKAAASIGISMPEGHARTPDTDLFGYPQDPGRGKRGRPRYLPTPRDRNRVRLLLALGWSSQRIANAVEISLPTLNRAFRPELKARDAMRDRLEARRFEIAMEQANAGNVAALRELGAMIEKNDRMEIERELGVKENASPENSRLGKKAVDEMRAMAADADLMTELEREAQQAKLN